jgi:hypothetical protein
MIKLKRRSEPDLSLKHFAIPMVAHSSPLARPWTLLPGPLAATALALSAAPAIQLGAGRTLVPRLSFIDPLGQTHTRLEQYDQGFRIGGRAR